MNAKTKILEALGGVRKPAGYERAPLDRMRFEDLSEAFGEALRAAGGEVLRGGAWATEAVAGFFSFEGAILDTREGPIAALPERIGLAVVEGSFGVVENGAVWIEPKGRYPRALLTLAENLAVVVPADALVPTMHEAYGRLDFSDLSYGLFMAGPSKTADIEQALVIGAHGAIGMKVFLESGSVGR